MFVCINKFNFQVLPIYFINILPNLKKNCLICKTMQKYGPCLGSTIIKFVELAQLRSI